MQIELNPTSSNPGYLGANDALTSNPAAPHALANYQIIRRNGAVVPFEPTKLQWPS
jgi:ribonucleoside-diphosphate reductase alpha chain